MDGEAFLRNNRKMTATLGVLAKRMPDPEENTVTCLDFILRVRYNFEASEHSFLPLQLLRQIKDSPGFLQLF